MVKRKKAEMDLSDGILRLRCPKPLAINPSLDSSELISRLLAPMSLESFLSSCWAEKPLLVQGPLQRLAPIISHMKQLDLQEMLEETPSEQVHAWLRSSTTGSKDEPSGSALQSVALDAAAALMLAQTRQAALYFRAPEALEDLLVPGICNGLGAAFAGLYPGDSRPRGEIETFVAQSGHVTGWHTDFQHNFTFQLRGSKRWRFKKGPVKNNVRALTPHFQTKANFEQQMKLHVISEPSRPEFKPPDHFFADADVVDVTAGDILYHPAGIWHHVECTGEIESISINVSVSCATWADLVSDAIHQSLWSSASLRAPIVGLTVDYAAAVRQVEERLREAKKWINSLTAEDLLSPAMLEMPRLPSRIHIGRSRLGHQLQVSQSSCFRFSQLCALVELPEDLSDSEEELPQSSKRFVLHANFGNEDVSSWLRVLLVAPKNLLLAMSWLQTRQLSKRSTKKFKAKEVLTASKTSWSNVCRLLRVLQYCGLVLQC
ncbi:unnamed protein product [Cladocopium goreaui]|uniref:JmjC domain-containing protein n=1 Tax=Cladocopium goreaui TaxID=2562237 RepID=A0A9P1GFS9_9DINO|nr:unnamed protein product [Cladocopium goreaui]